MQAQIDAVIRAVSHVMSWPEDVLAASTPFASSGVDSIALIVIADVIESQNPSWSVSDDVLKSARNIEMLAAGIVVGDK
ncbi:MAG: hypothetical protein RIS75_483 [Actinomycetota bacterium]|jgi:hypothetical protein